MTNNNEAWKKLKEDINETEIELRKILLHLKLPDKTYQNENIKETIEILLVYAKAFLCNPNLKHLIK